MNLQLTVRPNSDGFHILATAQLLGGDTAQYAMVSPARDAAITTVLVHAWARMADRYVASLMALLPHPHHGPLAHDVERFAGLILMLDGVTGNGLSLEQAATAIYNGVGLMANLTGKPAWSGHTPRKAYMQELRELAALIHLRATHQGPFCETCLRPATACACQPATA